jgi:predicted dehydrogenase
VIQFVAGTTRTVTPEVEAFAKQKGLHLTASYDNMLHHAGVDAVVLATPHSMHATQVMAAAAAKKHVYCEKPFTLTKREAEDAVAAVRKAGVTLAVGYNRRFHPEMTKLRDMIRGGELGTILHVEATMTFPNVLFINPSHWRADKSETPLGGLMPMGVHAIDGMIDLCGPIDHVFAQTFRRAAPIDADDTTSILLREGGARRLSRHHDHDRAGFQLPGLRLQGLAAAGRPHARGRCFIRRTAHAPVRHLQIPAVKGEAESLGSREASMSLARRSKPSLSRRRRPAYPVTLDQAIRASPRPKRSSARPAPAR